MLHSMHRMIKHGITTAVAITLLMMGIPASALTITGTATVMDSEVVNDRPRQCLSIPAFLDQNQPYYSDFIQLSGHVSSNGNAPFTPQAIAVSTDDKALCFNELKFGYQYRVTFREGFPLKSGGHFKQSKDTFFAVPNMKSSIRFQGNSVVLPTIGAPKIPLTLVNADHFTVKVFRFSMDQVQQNDYLKSLSLLNEYRVDDLERETELVGEQPFSIDVPANQPTTYNLDISELVNAGKSGAYALVIEPDASQIELGRWDDRPTQYVIFTDIGLSSYSGNDGMRVYARSYATAEPLGDTQVDLIGRNQEVLESLDTNAQGYVQFSVPIMSGVGGLTPVQIRATNVDGLYSFMDLERQALDLSDRPVAGAKPLGLFNAYLYTERGVYRPGEEMVLTGLVRNKGLVAPANVPLTLKVDNAEGKEQFSRLIGHLEQGGLQQRFTIPKTSKTGSWSAHLYLNTDDDPIGSVSFSVEDYVPETLEVSLESDQLGYTGKALVVALQSDYLYGAPAVDLSASAEVNLTPKRRLFADLPEYVYGSYGNTTKTLRLDVDKTDDTGLVNIRIPEGLITPVAAKQAQVIRIVAGVTEPSGRIVRSRLEMPVLNYSSWVGVRVKNENEAFDRDAPVIFDLMNTVSDLTPINHGQLRYKVVQEDWDYHWYYSNGWRYTLNRYDIGQVTSGELTTNADGMARLDIGAQKWGRYRLQVTDLKSGQITLHRYRVGWWNTSGAQSAIPDQVKMALSQNEVEEGATVSLKITPPYAGKLHLLIANDTIIEERYLDIPAEGIEVDINVVATFGPDAYILANVYRLGQHSVGPARAVGISHLTVLKPQHTAKITVIAPEKIEPNQTVKIEVHTSLPEGSRVVLAAVDEGILQLTRYQSPDPKAFFLAKRRLGIEIMDLYGHLIQHQDGETLRVHFGGDVEGAGGSDVAPLETFVKPVALVSDLAPVDANGNVTIEFDVPQFNGRLRLMAIGFNEQRMGSASGNMIVRDPVVVQPVLPRFMSVGDQAEVAVSLHNLELPTGEFILDWDATDNYYLSERHQVITLEQDQRTNVGIRVQALSAQAGRVGLTVTRPDGVKQYYHWDLTAITNRFIEQYETSVFIGAGNRGTIGSDVGELTSDSRQVIVRATDRPLLETDWISKSLSRYPFGCLEQTTSKAWPALYVSDAAWSESEKAVHINKAINHISQMQLNNGAFSLWRGGRTAEMWLTMYAMEFLQEAKQAGFEVPQTMLTNGMTFVENINSDLESVQAYAMYLRTKYGNPDAGEARYLASKLSKSAGVQTRVHLAATFDLLGDKSRSLKLLGDVPSNGYYVWHRYDYRSVIRDRALYSYYALNNNSVSQESKALMIEKLEDLFLEAKNKRYISTQEKGWLLRLASLNKGAEVLSSDLPISVDFRGTTLSELGPYLAEQSTWSSVKNNSDEDMFIKVSSSGVNKGLTDAFSNNMEVTTEYTNLSTGSKLDLNEVKQGIDVLVLHKVVIDDVLEYDMELSIEAPVPAGFELENPRLSSGRKLMTTVTRLKPDFEEYRDDRYVGAWSLSRGYRTYGVKDKTFYVGYVMRAVTPGSFLVPSISIEDMYQPQFRANTAESHVVITAD